MIRTQSLTRRFGPVVAVDRLTMELPAGSVTGVLGPNGAGKSTLLRLLLGLASPTSGTAFVLGYDVGSDALAIRRSVGLLPDAKALPEGGTVARFLRFYASFFPNAEPEVSSSLLERWGVVPDRRVRTLSRGERTKVLLAAVLGRRARLVFLDEPSEGLDPAAVEDVWSVLFESLTRSDEAGVLLCTHRLEEVERLCDRVLVLHRGRLVLEGDLDELRTSWRRLVLRPHDGGADASPPPGVRLRNGVLQAIVADWQGSAPPALAAVGEVVEVAPVTLREIYFSVTADGD